MSLEPLAGVDIERRTVDLERSAVNANVANVTQVSYPNQDA
jgi:hypothetical protein